MEDEARSDPLLKVTEVADMFGVKPATIRDWLREGLITGVKIGRGHYWRIRKSEAIRRSNQLYGSNDG